MKMLILILIAVNCAVCAYCLVRIAVVAGNSRRGAAIEERYIGLLARHIDFRPDADACPLADARLSTGEKIIIGELLCSMKDNFAEYDGNYFRDIIGERCRKFYVGRTGWSIGFRRARYLRILSVLPSQPDDKIACGFLNNGYCNFYKMLIDIDTSPERSIDIIKAYRSRMSPKAVQKVSRHLSGSGIRIDWHKFVSSNDANLIMIGMSIIAAYQISGGAESVYNALSNPDRGVRDTAMQTLVGLKSPVTDSRVDDYVKHLEGCGRRRFYRFLVREGYSRSVMQTYVEYEAGCRSGLDGYIKSLLDNRRLSLRT